MTYQRIISVVPSQTELLAYLGADEQVVGITKFCIHPNNWFRAKTRVGGTKNLNINKIHELKPDLILANKEENTKEQIEELQRHYRVYVSDILTWRDAMAMINEVGNLLGRQSQAQMLVNELQQKHDEWFTQRLAAPRRAAYLIWRQPYMAAASETFIDEMLQIAGFQNVFAKQKRYPEISIDDLQNACPDYILLSSEPYPFSEIHIAELQTHCPKSRIILVDGELFSWYGSRLLLAFEYFRSL